MVIEELLKKVRDVLEYLDTDGLVSMYAGDSVFTDASS